jgi:hypothetical protein
MRTLYTNAGFISTFISVRLQNCVICTVDGCFSVQDHQKSSIRFCTMYKRNVQIPIPFQASSTYFPALPSLCTDSPSATHGHQAGTVPAVGGVNYRLCAKRKPSPGGKVARKAGRKRNSGDNLLRGIGKDLLTGYVFLSLFLRTVSNVTARIPLQSKIASSPRFLPASPRGKRERLRR